jgi:hypothetical protein
MALMQLTPFRCRGCGSRFYRRALHKLEDEEPSPVTENRKTG